ncbi:myb-like DNA-binding domain-containing protein [Hypoxylon fragiforme]|uniref:myb-like DNA-binding domain-containing protein n=1 Tax=Hypoxylon fragiforme TaxID=63214 RepID=UPI0020C73919|nr:myb-like DNA-binding domain-containing protein [Hypoxylon fragiforme]KAI2608468.1 myb-like DNA-binding domain-containing protein [Hypoxylon fragiforme]
MSSQRRGPWSQREDDLLAHLVHSQGAMNWVRVSQQIGTRSSKQCRERYHQNLKPSLNHNPITPEEGAQIERMVQDIGKRWAEIARSLNNRSDNAVKNWWNGSMNRRKRLNRRKATDFRDRTTSPGPFPYYSQAPQLSAQAPQLSSQAAQLSSPAAQLSSQAAQSSSRAYRAPLERNLPLPPSSRQPPGPVPRPDYERHHYSPSSPMHKEGLPPWKNHSGFPSTSVPSPLPRPQGVASEAPRAPGGLFDPRIRLPPLRISDADSPSSVAPLSSPRLPPLGAEQNQLRLPSINDQIQRLRRSESNQLVTAPSSPMPMGQSPAVPSRRRPLSGTDTMSDKMAKMHIRSILE